MSIKTIKIDNLVEDEDNPNRMTDVELESLARFIERVGFLQPALVVDQGDGTYKLVDGHHRTRAARLAGLDKIPCVVKKPDEVDVAEARAIQVGINRLRGELDLGLVADAFVELQTAGWSPEDLAVTGFDADEVRDLLTSASFDEDDLFDSDIRLPSYKDAPADEDSRGPAPSTWTLEFSFEDKDAYTQVVDALKLRGGVTAKALLQLVQEGE